MGIYANINGDTIKLYYDKDEHSIYEEVEYRLGEELLNFLWLPADYINNGYRKLIEAYSGKEAYSDEHGEYMEFFGKAINLADTIDRNYVYLHFYTKHLVWFMGEYPFEQPDKVSKRDILDRFIKNGFPYLSRFLEHDLLNPDEEIYQMESIYTQLCGYADNTNDSRDEYRHVFELASELILLEVKVQKTLIHRDLEVALSTDGNFEGMTPLQRLLYFECCRYDPIYIESSFNTILMQYPEICSLPNEEDELKRMIVEKGSTFILMHPIDRIDDLIKLETYFMLANKIIIKKCKYCGNYFIPGNRSDTDYCSRIKENETKPCNIVGPKRVYDMKKRNDPIIKAHHKAYNRMRAKLRTERITKSEFCDWSNKATYMREQCKAGSISFDEYQTFLDEDKTITT